MKEEGKKKKVVTEVKSWFKGEEENERTDVHNWKDHQIKKTKSHFY